MAHAVIDAFEMKLTYAFSEDKEEIIKQQEKHHKEAELAYQTKIKDKRLAKETNKMTVLVFYLQQYFPTPCLQTSIVFNKTQLCR